METPFAGIMQVQLFWKRNPQQWQFCLARLGDQTPAQLQPVCLCWWWDRSAAHVWHTNPSSLSLSHSFCQGFSMSIQCFSSALRLSTKAAQEYEKARLTCTISQPKLMKHKSATTVAVERKAGRNCLPEGSWDLDTGTRSLLGSCLTRLMLQGAGST